MPKRYVPIYRQSTPYSTKESDVMSIVRAITVGTFDFVIHEGHIRFLKQCNVLCDELYVIVVADSVVERNKGRQPYYTQKTRAANVTGTGLIRRAYTPEEGQQMNYFFGCHPDIYIIGGDQLDNRWAQLAAESAKLSGIVTVHMLENFIRHTSEIIEAYEHLYGS